MSRCRVVLADLNRPPDTSALIACDEARAASAIETTRVRLIRRRKALLERSSSAEIDRIVAKLRRLQNPHLTAYHAGTYVLLSEPFNALPCAAVTSPMDVASRAIRTMLGAAPPRRLVRALAPFGEAALRAAIEKNVRISIVPDARRYAEFSSAVARLVPTIDEWSSPPAGLFVVEERRMLLRTRAMAMTAAHEFAHAMDSVLAARPRSYFSYENEELRQCFAASTGFVNEYAASGLDEYFAESVRAYLEINDNRCAWLPLTRYELNMRDPRMFELIDRLFASGFDRSAVDGVRTEMRRARPRSSAE